jgi:hypothetical protein
MEQVNIEKCGCEFRSVYSDEGESMCLLTRCRCEKHYEEQFVAEWSDHEGHHREQIQPENPLRLEVQNKGNWRRTENDR